MKKDDKNKMDNSNTDVEQSVSPAQETGVAVAPLDEATDIAPYEAQEIGSFGVSLRERVEMDADINSLRKELEDGIGGYTKPTDLVAQGVVFDIIDAYLTTMIEETGEERSKVVFEIVESDTGIIHKVMQSDDSRGIRRKYATLFSLCKARGIPSEPLRGYHFIEGNKIVAGNKSIILERVSNFARSA